MIFAKSLAVLTTAALVAASPVARAASGVTCYFIMTPNLDLSIDVLQGSIDYAVAHALGKDYPHHELEAQNSLVRHNDGTYDVTTLVTVDGISNDDVVTSTDGWEGKTLDGYVAQWSVGAAACYD